MNDQNTREHLSSSNIVPIDGIIIDVDATDGAIIDVAPLYESPMNETNIHEMIEGNTDIEAPVALLNPEESGQFRTHWNEIQGRFVDEPRSAVQQADLLVSEVIEKITRMFAEERSSLEEQWNQGNDVTTENLRMALKRYRSFFNRLILQNEE